MAEQGWKKNKKTLNLHLIFIKVLVDDTAQVAWFII